jgi:type II secretory pathway component PulM
LQADRGLKRSLDQLVSEVDLADEAEAEAVPPKRHEQDVIDGATTDFGSSSME